MLQKTPETEHRGRSQTAHDCAILGLALRSLNAVKRDHEPGWPCVVGPRDAQEQDAVELQN